MAQHTCVICGAITTTKFCPAHTPTHDGRSPYRDRQKQRTFRDRVLTRDHHACRRCGSREDLRAAHIIPLSAFLDPADPRIYHPANGITLCAECDQAADPYARP